jgi:hypothetical protein
LKLESQSIIQNTLLWVSISVPELTAVWGGLEAEQLLEFLKAALLPTYNGDRGGCMGLEAQLGHVTTLLRLHLKMLDSQKSLLEARNCRLMTEIENLENQERRLIAATVIKTRVLNPQSLISQVEEEVLAELG